MSKKMKKINFVIITGLSGAGKTQASRCFEDLGYFCVDNLPPQLLPQFAELCKSQEKISNVALVIDIRGGEFFNNLLDSLGYLKSENLNLEILFLDAQDDVLVHRFKEAKRKHPLSGKLSILHGIKKERELLQLIKEKANYIIDTSNTTIWELKRKIFSIFSPSKSENITVNIISFGYKYGIPDESDLVFDVRFMPNPNYDENLQSLTGLDKPAREYILNSPVAQNFLQKLFDMVSFLIPLNIAEGKHILNISIGCTGGRHRSVAVAKELQKFLKKNNFNVLIKHRDINKK